MPDHSLCNCSPLWNLLLPQTEEEEEKSHFLFGRGEPHIAQMHGAKKLNPASCYCRGSSLLNNLGLVISRHA